MCSLIYYARINASDTKHDTWAAFFSLEVRPLRFFETDVETYVSRHNDHINQHREHGERQMNKNAKNCWSALR